jgi:hypothetical protein
MSGDRLQEAAQKNMGGGTGEEADVRGHVLGDHSHVLVKAHLASLRFEQISIWRIKESFGSVAGKAAEVCKPWLAEASQDCDPKRRHLLEDNPTAG